MKNFIRKHAKYIYPVIFILFLLFLSVLSMAIYEQYVKYLTPGWTLIYVIFNHLFDSHLVSIGVATFLAVSLYIFDVKFQKEKSWKHYLKLMIPYGVLLLYLFLVKPNYLEPYTIDGELQSNLNFIQNIKKDIQDEKQETISFDKYEMEQRFVSFSSRNGTSIQKYYFLNIEDGTYVLPVPGRYIHYVEKMLREAEGQQEVTVYANSKMITHVNGFFLPELSQSVVDEYIQQRKAEQCKISVDEEGNIQLEMKNPTLQKSELAMSFYNEEGTMLAQIGLTDRELSLNYVIGTSEEGIYQVYVTKGPVERVSNILQVEVREGKVYQVQSLESI